VTDRSHLAAYVDRMAQVRVLCVGDLMLDRYVYGAVERISPEAPIPVLRVEREVAMLGGAGNVVRNLGALGAASAFVSLIGDDAAGREVSHLLGQQDRVDHPPLLERGRATSIKTRFIAGGQQLLRADQETVVPVGGALERQIVEQTRALLDGSAVVVLSDYGKGVLSDRVVRGVIEAAREAGRPAVVDPKGADYRRYRGATVITPNRRELAAAANGPVADIDAVVQTAADLLTACGIDSAIVTLGRDGMALVNRRGARHFATAPRHLGTEAREVYDVSGAGDTVVAAYAAALAAGASPDEAARLANAAAGIVVGKAGTAVVHATELIAELHAQDLRGGEAKLLGLAEALDRLADWRARGLRIGFTNGCFDLLHPGHVRLLEQARTACDRLIVGLNSDDSARRLKGPDRPVQSEAARAVVLGSLATVDLIVVFDEETPIELIRAIRPEVLVKGADYTIEQVVGADLVRGYGGRVLLADLLEGHSTTATIARLAP
jgi:D-beta-D-heptose 7-phosphate kinase/D-beta-D-heptose 1-phosphate adenosyltransferase